MAKTVHNDERVLPESNDWFFKVTTLEDLVGRSKPLARMEDLAIEDLTPEEIRAFLDAIRE